MKCNNIKTQTIKDQLYHNKVLMVDVKINYPYLDMSYSRNSAQFNMHYRQRARKNYRYASTKFYQSAVKQYRMSQAQNFPFHNFEFLEVFESTYCKMPLISLFFDIYEFTGGAHGNTVRSGNTWDIRRGRLLPLEYLFVDDYYYVPIMLDYIETEATRRQITGTAHYFDNLKENIKKYFDPKNYYLDENGIAIFYPLYTIAPYVEGIQVFVVPYKLFGNNLRYKFT